MELKKLWQGMKESIKIILIALLISTIGFYFVNNYLAVGQKVSAERIAEIDLQISMMYDRETDTYTNPVRVIELQKESIRIQYANQNIQLIRVALVALLLVTLSALLGWWMQYIYTSEDFVKRKEGDIVIAVCLISATAVVLMVYYMISSGA